MKCCNALVSQQRPTEKVLMRTLQTNNIGFHELLLVGHLFGYTMGGCCPNTTQQIHTLVHSQTKEHWVWLWRWSMSLFLLLLLVMLSTGAYRCEDSLHIFWGCYGDWDCMRKAQLQIRLLLQHHRQRHGFIDTQLGYWYFRAGAGGHRFQQTSVKIKD